MSTDSLLLDTVERLFSELLTPEYLAGAERSGAGEFLALTREIGLDTVLVGQEEGGYGGSWSDAFVVAEACGRYAAPGHLPEIMVRRGLGESAEQAEKRSGSLPLPAGALLRSAQMV